MAASPSSYPLLRDRLLRAGARRTAVARLFAAARAAGRAPGALLLLALLDWAFPLPAWILLPAATAGALWFAADLVRFAAARACRRRTPEAAALELEAEQEGRLDNLLIGALQLGAELEEDPAVRRHSPLLVRALVERAADEAKTLSAEAAPRPRGWRASLAAALATAACWGIFVLAAPEAARVRWAHLADAWNAAVEFAFPVELEVAPGSTSLLRGSPLELTVAAKGARRPTIVLDLLDAEGVPVETRDLPLESRRAVFHVDSVQDDFQYRFRYGRRQAGPFLVRAGDRPVIQAVNYELTYPLYTGQMPRILTGRQMRLQAISGTAVLVSFAASTPLHPDLTYVEWQDGSRQPVSVNGRFGHFAFAITQADRATLHLANRLGAGFEMAEPWPLDIAVVRDQAPQVRIALHGGRSLMLAGQAAALAVPYVAEDDFGVAEIRLEYKIEALDELLGRAPREGALTRIIDPASDRVVGRFPDPFAELDPPLAPGDRVSLEVVALDNNSETGPGAARSSAYEVVVVQDDLGAYAEARLGFGASTALLRGLKRVKRNTTLLVEPDRTVRSEDRVEIEAHDLDARNSPDLWPAGSEDSIGDYFRLLSGAQ
jgi:hypothetical protein